jgi:hypothetical protein
MPPTSPSSEPPRQGWLTTLGWGAYLACSWTWCIGMFLPVLLVRDFGIWGFVVFAVPNVVGAAGMGWVLRASSAGEILRTHASAVRAFSEVTWAFQIYFLLWLIVCNSAIGLAAASVAFVLVMVQMFVAGYGASAGANRRWAMFLWLMSAGFMAWGLVRGLLGVPHETPQLDPSHLVWLSPVCAFGFLLCPYLDITFLLARRSQQASGARASFTLGFGLLFAAMIAFTLLYAGRFAWSGAPVSLLDSTGVVASLIYIHIILQISFTTLVHGSARVAVTGRRGIDLPRGIVIGVLAPLFAIVATWPTRSHSGLSSGEIIYRLFMSFYGLVFPAYVWLCMIPVRGERGTQKPTRAKLTVLGIAVALAAPCFWMGFIERQTWWLGPGLGVVLVARVFIPRGRDEVGGTT